MKKLGWQVAIALILTWSLFLLLAKNPDTRVVITIIAWLAFTIASSPVGMAAVFAVALALSIVPNGFCVPMIIFVAVMSAIETMGMGIKCCGENELPPGKVSILIAGEIIMIAAPMILALKVLKIF